MFHYWVKVWSHATETECESENYIWYWTSLSPANEVWGRWCFHRCLSVWGGLGNIKCIMLGYIGQLIGTCGLTPLPRHQTWDLPPNSDIWLWPLDTCLNLFIWGSTPGSDILWWQLKLKHLWFSMHPTGMLSCWSMLTISLSHSIFSV